MGCSSRVTGSEEARQGALAEDKGGDPGGKGSDPGDKGSGCTPDKPPAGDGCTSGGLGDGVTCLDYGDFKQASWDACQKMGLDLVDVAYSSDGCPDGQSSKVTYACCPAPPPPPQQCTKDELGDGVTCLDYGDLKQASSDACQKMGLDLVDVDFSSVGCPAGQSSKVAYACCPASPPPPPPPPQQCTKDELGDGVTCLDYGDLKQASSDACQKMGLDLVDVDFSSVGCPAGQSSKVAYACCQPAASPDPCTYGKLGDGAVCQDESAMKQAAVDACTADGLSFQGLKLPGDCPGGQSSWGEYICCPAASP